MRVPLTWLKDYVKIPKDLGELTHKLTMAGHMLDKLDHQHGNTIVDLELRGNRADCYSILGIAREVSALFALPLTYPSISAKRKTVKQLNKVNLEIKTPLVKRVMMTTISQVKITPSPKWLKEKLVEYGVESINNIVDLTNYVMLETGEPMHAFDLDKVGSNLHIRLAKDKEQMLTFLGKTLTLTKEDLVWANNTSALSVAGAIGEKTHSISNDTKNILLEAANYDRANIRRSIHRHSLFTEAGIRHEKELDPNLVEFAIYRFIHLLEKNKWGIVAKEVSDYYPNPAKPWKVNLNYGFLESLSGIKIPEKKVKDILTSLEFRISKESATHLEVEVPTHRTDVVLEEDLVEEVVRILGYDNLPNQTLSLEIPEVITPNYIKQELKLKNDLVALGFDEVISQAFVEEKSLHLNKPINEYKEATYKEVSEVRIINKPSPDTEVLRMSLLPNLYAAAEKVRNERGELVQFFEIGKVYAKHKNDYIEKRRLGVIYWNKEENDYYQFKGIIDSVFEKIQLDNPSLDIEKSFIILTSSYHLKSGKEIVGQAGKYKDYHYLEIDLDSILEKTKSPSASLWPKYPPQIEDVTLTLPEMTKVGEVIDEIKKTKYVVKVDLKDIYETAYTFRIYYQNPEKTLTNEEVEKIRDSILNNLNKKFGASLKN